MAKTLLWLLLPICILSIICIILGIYLHLSNNTLAMLRNDKYQLTGTILKMSERIIQLERNINVGIVSTDIHIGDAISFMTDAALVQFTIRTFSR